MRPFRSVNVSGLEVPTYQLWFARLPNGTRVGNGTQYQFGTRSASRAADFNWRNKLWVLNGEGTASIYLGNLSSDPDNSGTGGLIAWSSIVSTPGDTTTITPGPDFTDGGADVALDVENTSVTDTRMPLASAELDPFVLVPTEAFITIRLYGSAPVYRYEVEDAVIATTGETIHGLSYWADFRIQVDTLQQDIGWDTADGTHLICTGAVGWDTVWNPDVEPTGEFELETLNAILELQTECILRTNNNVTYPGFESPQLNLTTLQLFGKEFWGVRPGL